LTEFGVDQFPVHSRAVGASERWPHRPLRKPHSTVVVKTGLVHWIRTLVRPADQNVLYGENLKARVIYLKRSNLGHVATGFLQSACWFFKYSVMIPSRVRLGGSKVLSGTYSLISTFSNEDTGSFL
jgi:hypothetical protein